MLVASLLSSRAALPADDTKAGFVGCKTSIAYFPQHKVVLCTVPKASSSSWREFARRVHAVDHGKPSPNIWCGRSRLDFNGCLLDQPWAPPGVHSFDQLKNLVETALPGILRFLFLIYPLITNVAFEAFPC